MVGLMKMLPKWLQKIDQEGSQTEALFTVGRDFECRCDVTSTPESKINTHSTHPYFPSPFIFFQSVRPRLGPRHWAIWHAQPCSLLHLSVADDTSSPFSSSSSHLPSAGRPSPTRNRRNAALVLAFARWTEACRVPGASLAQTRLGEGGQRRWLGSCGPDMLGRGGLLGLELGHWFWRDGLVEGDVVVNALDLSRGVSSAHHTPSCPACGLPCISITSSRKLIDVAV
jgi:hypothetical protein